MNPQKIALVTDSCADIPAGLIKKYDIHVIPLRLLFSDGEYEDGISITAKEVYRRLPSELPKTSLPSAVRIEETFQDIRCKGYEKAIAINFSGGLSGTANMVRLLGEQCVGLEVAAFDTLSGSLGTGMTVLQAARWLEEGRGFVEVCHAIPRIMHTTTVFFCIDTLEYLQKGGRIGLITSFAGTLLNIKPIISFAPSGELVNVAKVRGRKLAIQKMVAMAADLVPEGAAFNIAVAHGDSPAEFKEIRALAKQSMPGYKSLFEGEIDGTLGVYTGPHLLGVGVQLLPEGLFPTSV